MTARRRCMDLSALEALRMLRYSRDMWDVDVYFMDKVVAMVQCFSCCSGVTQRRGVLERCWRRGGRR